MTVPSRMSGAANSVVVPFRLSSCVIVAGRPGFIGSPFCVRPSVWICVFSSIEKTAARSGGFMYNPMTSQVFSLKSVSMPSGSSFEKCAAVAPEQMHILKIEPKTDIVARSERKARRSAHDQGRLRYPCLEVHD